MTLILATIWNTEDAWLLILVAVAVLAAVGFFGFIYAGSYINWRRRVEQEKAMERVARLLAARPSSQVPRDKKEKQDQPGAPGGVSSR